MGLTFREQAQVRLLIVKSEMKLDAWSIHRMSGLPLAAIVKFLERDRPKPTSSAQRKVRQALREERLAELRYCPVGRDRVEHERIVAAVFGEAG